MRLCKVVYIVVLLFFSLQFTHATGYVDLSTYDGKKYKDSQEGLIEGLFESGWSEFKSSLKETIFTDNINSEKFWNTLRISLQNGSFYNRLANYQTFENMTGSDLFLKALYSSIEQIPVKYKSVLPNGDSIMLSGKIFLPKNTKAKHIIIANHYTICANSEAPSNAYSIEGIYAIKDYIVLMPDYIGYGITDSLTHPYLHLKSSVTSAIDLLDAAVPYLKSRSYTYFPSVILLGYSQGAAVTLALQKELEQNYSHKYAIYKVFAGAGPYDLAGTFDYYISHHTTDIPCTLPMLVLGMNYGENLGLDTQDFFQPVLQEKYPHLIESKAKMMHEVNQELGNDMNVLLKPIVFQTDSLPTSILYEAVKRNSILQWTPKSNLFLFHSTEDNMVPFLNSEHIKAIFDAQDLENIEYDFSNYGNHMNAAVTFFEKVYRSL